MEGIGGVTAACTPCRRRWQTARDGDGPAGDLQPHILSANTLTPPSEQLLMKTCVSSSSACQTQRRCWTCRGWGQRQGHVLPVCGRGRVPKAAPCLTEPTGAPSQHGDRPNRHEARCKHGPERLQNTSWNFGQAPHWHGGHA